MAERMQLDYDAAREMVRALLDAAQRAEDMAAVMKRIGGKIEERGVVHPRGREWAGALQDQLVNRLLYGRNLLEETASDVQKAIEEFTSQDSSGAGRF